MKGTTHTGGLFEGKGGRGKAIRVVGPDESFIQKKITEFLDGRAVVYAVTNARTVQTTDGPRQMVYPQGWPDITAIFPLSGRIWAIEVKTDDGDQREAQKDMQALIEATGGIYTVARDCVLIRQILNEHLLQYQARELSAYFLGIDRLFSIFRAHLSARRAAAKVSRAIRRFQRGAQTNKRLSKEG